MGSPAGCSVKGDYYPFTSSLKSISLGLVFWLQNGKGANQHINRTQVAGRLVIKGGPWTLQLQVLGDKKEWSPGVQMETVFASSWIPPSNCTRGKEIGISDFLKEDQARPIFFQVNFLFPLISLCPIIIFSFFLMLSFYMLSIYVYGYVYGYGCSFT